MTRKSPAFDDVVAGLHRLLRRGLPTTINTADPLLLNLRGVVARAIEPDEFASRTAALDGLLRGMLARYDDTKHAAAARALFGLAPAESGQNLTTRREIAAKACEHEVNHFRKRVEPRIVDHIASALLSDADRFTRTRTIAPRLTAAPGRQLVPADPFAWEVTEHEESLSSLWAAIYALRAELLAVERLVSLGVDEADVVPRVITAAWRWGAARNAAEYYVDTYEPDETADGLVALAGWTPALSNEHAAKLRNADDGANDRTAFLTVVRNDVALGMAWVTPFLKPDRINHNDSQERHST